MQQVIKTKDLRTVAPHFQRSINLTYDASNADYIAGYIPTPNGSSALAKILDNTTENGRQRAHVLHAAYGSGKSLLGLVLNALASKDPICQSALDIVQDRLNRAFPVEAERLHTYRTSNRRLLTVLLSGDEGPLDIALARALMRALSRENLDQLYPHTRFQAALETIALWERAYPEVHQCLDAKLVQIGWTSLNLIHDLKVMQPEALAMFEQLYPDLTAGARFDGYTGQKSTDVFYATAKALQSFCYDGIIIIWDEFGRFIESRIDKTFGEEAALLQSFAEFCNRSSTNQVHLILITHRLLSGYVAKLPTNYQQEWARIAERFHPHDVASDPLVTYRLIAETLVNPPEASELWQQFTEQYRTFFDDLTARSLELALFEDLDDVTLRQEVIERTWPLHPLAVYALPRLSGRVAQNERTLFTFLATDEPGTLIKYLAKDKTTWWLVGLDVIWDYFAEAIRNDIAPGGAHTVWSGVMYALSKISHDDTLACSLIKTLGILLIVGEANVQSGRGQTNIGRIVPTTELLAWALDIQTEDVTACLERLTQRRALVLRRADGYWTFTRGSDVDLDTEIGAAIEHRAPTFAQMRQLLERDISLPFNLPRSYNLERRMTRYFWGLYRWSGEMGGVVTDDFLKQLGSAGYADGAIVYVLITNLAEQEEVQTLLLKLPQPPKRLVYVIPENPLLITELLRELFALYDLKSDPTFIEQDERLSREIEFFIEDTQRRLRYTLHPFLDPGHEGTIWWWHDGSVWQRECITTPSDISRLLSHLCDLHFGETPILNNELLNQHEPSGQQVHAAEKVIDALLVQPFGDETLPTNLGLTGNGPEILILRTLLVRPGLLSPATEEYSRLERPVDNKELARVWNIVHNFLDKSLENEQEASILTDMLLSPPLGIRRGVLPVLLAAMLRPRSRVLTIRRNRKVISPLTGEVFTQLCRWPDQFTIELGRWSTQHSVLWQVLEKQFEEFLVENELEQQPLKYLSNGLLRWLQTQPRFCRDTNQVSTDARKLRDLIRKTQREPARVLLYELLDLLNDRGVASEDSQSAYQQVLTERLTKLMDEIAMAYQSLLYHLDSFAKNNFAADNLTGEVNGYTALNYWLIRLEQQIGESLDTFRYNDILAQRLIRAIRQEQDDNHFWDRVSEAVLGIHLSDWNDHSIENFKNSLLDAKDRLEREVFELAQNEDVIELNVSLPGAEALNYRFRPSDLSSQGQRLLQNFKSTLEIAGRPLSPDERRQVTLALLHYVLDGLEFNGRQGNHQI